MPHVIVKLYAGRSDAQKRQIAEGVTQAIMTATGHGPDAVSVGIEDVQPSEWVEQVYRPDILGKADTLFKEPGYDPLKERAGDSAVRLMQFGPLALHHRYQIRCGRLRS